MTNKEAIAVIKTLCHTCEFFPKCVNDKPECFKALEMAIDALRNFPTQMSGTSEDTISRQAAIDALMEQFKRNPTIAIRAKLTVEGLQSAQPETARTFVELVVEYPDPELCTYKEYKGKPYYSIKYIENGETYVGYGTYNPEALSQYLKEYFISSVQSEPSQVARDIATIINNEKDMRVVLENSEPYEAAKRLSDLIFDINPVEICSQIESDNLKQWCKIIQTEMRMAMVQLPCWSEKEKV